MKIMHVLLNVVFTKSLYVLLLLQDLVEEAKLFNHSTYIKFLTPLLLMLLMFFTTFHTFSQHL